MAQRKYDYHYGPKTVGKFRRRLRDVMDKCSAPIQNAMKVDYVDMASLVVGEFVDILLDVSDLVPFDT